MSMCRKRLIGITAGIISCCLAGVLLFAEQSAAQQEDKSFPATLKSQAERFFAEERFLEFLGLLNILREEKKQERDIFYIVYYLAHTKSLYLDYLEREEDWAHYYDQVSVFDKEIIQAAEYSTQQYPASAESIDLHYLAWKAHMREEDEEAAEEAFAQLVDEVITYTEKNDNISKFQEIAEIISTMGRMRQLNNLFRGYRDFLYRSEASASSIEHLAEIADGYLEKDNIDTARIVYKHYMSLILERYPAEKSRPAVLAIAEKFRHHGFSPALDADFAEEVYSIMDENFGPGAFGEAELFARGYNLDVTGDYARAAEEYKQFIKTIEQSVLLPEVYTRLGIISLYCLGQPEQAVMFFQRVIDEFSDSLYVPFCTYQAALYKQWNKEEKEAHDLYMSLMEAKGVFAGEAQARIKEIDDGTDMNKAVRYPFDLMLHNQSIPSIMLTLKGRPDRGFTHSNVHWMATAQDFSAGSTQPLFSYQWFGDLGSEGDPGNVTKFETDYAHASPKIVCFSAMTGDSESVLCKTVWIHDVLINSPVQGNTYKAETPVPFSAHVLPVSNEDDTLNWSWEVTGPEHIIENRRNFSYDFKHSGHYEVRLEVSGKGCKNIKKFSFDIF